MYKSTFLLTGLFSIICAALGLIPYGPYTSSIGFSVSTKIFDRVALIIRGALFTLLGFVPALGALFSTIPVRKGGAVLFMAYIQLFGTAA
ncbi:solute carrier family 23 protein [Peribacillus simplex]|uniref:solute carrier family 23 protein n=1 Tax=Peribacillus simplex TaxID=1478 RepID=UPI0009C17CC9